MKLTWLPHPLQQSFVWRPQSQSPCQTELSSKNLEIKNNLMNPWWKHIMIYKRLKIMFIGQTGIYIISANFHSTHFFQAKINVWTNRKRNEMITFTSFTFCWFRNRRKTPSYYGSGTGDNLHYRSSDAWACRLLFPPSSC